MFPLLLISIFTLPVTHVTYETPMPDAGTIYYKAGEKLKWSDFRSVTSLTDATAESSTSIIYDYERSATGATIKIYCTFNRKKSFVVKGKQTDYILQHEQIHFDITYRFAMEFKKQLGLLNSISEKQVERIYKNIIEQWSEYQELYDWQTDNSIDNHQQGIWNKSFGY